MTEGAIRYISGTTRGESSVERIDYLADVRELGEAKKAVADADFIPKPKVVKTGTDGD